MTWQPTCGAWPEKQGTRFAVWAPTAATVEVILHRAEPSTHPLQKNADGTFSGWLAGVVAGDRYSYRVDGQGPLPDPASRFQPDGVHGPSEVIDPAGFAWSDAAWGGLAMEDLVIYELHVGTFTPEGTFAGVAAKLPYLKHLGVTAIELMPIADFPGERNWGYDGVALFAPARCYGRPDDLRRLVDAAHRLGLAVILDVVYNHLGPDGNYLAAFCPFFFSDQPTTWGPAPNFDGPHSGPVRRFSLENAGHWINEYHIDGLRLDATHVIVDNGPHHFLAELAQSLHGPRDKGAGQSILVIAEDHRNLAKLLKPQAEGGWGLDGVWADDFHHQVRRLLAGDREGYYRDYSGSAADLAATIRQGWFYCGQLSVYRQRPRGTDPAGIPPCRFVICLQNHDQTGNRAQGERLHHQIEPAAYRAATALLLCAPQTPLLFMGQEWSASTPFLFFTDHHQELGQQVRVGRRQEFRHFAAFTDPLTREKIPDPQALSTFLASRLAWEERDREPHAAVLRLYEALLRLRLTEPALRSAFALSYSMTTHCQSPSAREGATGAPRWRSGSDQVIISRLLIEGGFAVAALDEGTILLQRWAHPSTLAKGTPALASLAKEGVAAGSSLLAVCRLQGAGTVDLGRKIAGIPLAGLHWEIVLTTEDPSFCPDPCPPRLDLTAPAPVIHFFRPSAIILKARIP